MVSSQSKVLAPKHSINCNGKLIDLSTPIVMGIINVTPDSFFDCGSQSEINGALRKAEKQLNAGAFILDIGAVSTRPGAKEVSEEIETGRLIPTIAAIKKHFPEVIVSADTFRASVAERAFEHGASIINDVSGGQFDNAMFDTVGKLNAPYVLTHMQGTSQTMQDAPSYGDLMLDLITYFRDRTYAAKAAGIKDIIIDAGFGFGKTIEHNYQMLKELNSFEMFGCPLLVGLSRKSMINKVLNTTPAESLNGTTALHMVALQNGASILRVHDVKEAVECVKLHTQLIEA